MYYKITQNDAIEFMASEDNWILVDVRAPHEYAQGYIPEAVNIPLDTLPQGVAGLDPKKPVMVYCRSGVRSEKAAGILDRAGFETVLDIGGIQTWPGKIVR